MNTKIALAAVLGGVGLLAIPAGVSYAVADAASAPLHAQAMTGYGQSKQVFAGAGQGASSGQGQQHGSAAAPASGTAGGSATAGQGGAQGNGHGSTSGNGNGAGSNVGGSNGGQYALADQGLALVDGTIGQTDIESLQFMVEEEKVARDLYLAFADEWNIRTFSQIAQSEQAHVDAIAGLLDAYGVDNPSAGLAVGEFSIPALQDLYDALLAQGLASSADALTVGALVEETDIQDLRDRSTSEAAVDLVFTNLEAGSENHLGAFVGSLDRYGVDYSAGVLTQAEVDRIVRG